MITLGTFRSSPSAPSDKGPAVEARWWLMKGDWNKAHACVQAHEGEADCDSVHAHLHRQEGDLGNAGYWYRRASKPVATDSLDAEWERIVSALI